MGGSNSLRRVVYESMYSCRKERWCKGVVGGGVERGEQEREKVRRVWSAKGRGDTKRCRYVGGGLGWPGCSPPHWPSTVGEASEPPDSR
jgi:hypothetical protein